MHAHSARNRRHWLSVWAFCVLLGGSGLAAAADTAYFCTHNPTELQAALTAAQADGKDDLIWVVGGNYALTTTLMFDSSEGLMLVLARATDNGGCAGDVLGPEAVLDGQTLVRPLYIANPGGGVILQALTIANGRATNGSAGGGAVVAGCTSCWFDYNRFYGNRVSNTGAQGGALLVNGTSDLRFYDNLVFANRATQVGGVVLNINGGDGYIFNNTIVANTTDTLNYPGGLLLKGSMNFHLTNNIICDDAAAGGADFEALSTNTRTTNDICSITTGSTPGTLSGEIAIAPQFADCGNACISFELASTSPLVNAGTDDVGTNPQGVVDLAGKPRILGPHIDMGAFENSDLIFADGFVVQ